VHTGFWWRNLREKSHLEDQGVGRGIIFRWIFNKWDGGMDWIDMVQGRKMWPTYKRGNEPSVP
jgi:hypothetical protein